jgi:hypothetical protein
LGLPSQYRYKQKWVRGEIKYLLDVEWQRIALWLCQRGQDRIKGEIYWYRKWKDTHSDGEKRQKNSRRMIQLVVRWQSSHHVLQKSGIVSLEHSSTVLKQQGPHSPIIDFMPQAHATLCLILPP